LAGQWTEAERLEALQSYGILDTAPEPEFDGIARIAALVCRTPIALVNFVAEHRQWFKAEIGLGRRETPIELAFCTHALRQPDLFIVPDTLLDPRFDCHPLVTQWPYLRFYAGSLVLSGEGLPIGTVCVLDREPRDGVTMAQGEVLLILARQVAAILDYRRRLAQCTIRRV
jgi:GAF domain-containing protein